MNPATIKEASDASVTAYRTYYQLHMHAISRSKHTKFKNTKIYSKGVLVNHTKISTNEISRYMVQCKA